jgi:hypothetical protein
VVALLSGFRSGGENTLGLDGAILLEEGVVDRVDADLRNTGGDLAVEPRTTPDTVRLRTGVGTGGSLDLADDAEIGDFVPIGCEDDVRRCGDTPVFLSCCMSGFRRICLNEASEVGANNFALPL